MLPGKQSAVCYACQGSRQVLVLNRVPPARLMSGEATAAFRLQPTDAGGRVLVLVVCKVIVAASNDDACCPTRHETKWPNSVRIPVSARPLQRSRCAVAVRAPVCVGGSISSPALAQPSDRHRVAPMMFIFESLIGNM